MTPQELKNSILQLAIQGKLVEQRPEEGTAEELFAQIQKEKQKLIAEKKIKKEKPVPEITDDVKPFNIPESWKWVRLREVANVTGGYAFKSTSFCDKGYRVIRISDFNEKGFINSKIVRHPFDESLTPFLLQEKNIMLCMTGGTVGKSYFVSSLDEPMLTNQRVATIKIIIAIEEYINFVILSPIVKKIIKKSKNSTNDNISMDTINSFPIPLPPLAEQKRIVAKIEELLPYIDRYETAWSKLEQFNSRFPEDMKKSLLQYAIQGKLVEQRPEEGTAEELFAQIQKEKQKLIAEKKIKKEKPLPEITDDEKPFDIPESWKWVRLGDVSTYNQRKEKISASDISKDMWSLDLEDIEKGNGKILNYCKASERKISGDKIYFHKGQVLYSKLRPYLKKILVAPNDGICSSEIVPFNLYGNIDTHFAVYFLKSPYVDFLINLVTYGVKMPRVGTDTMLNLLFPLPPLGEQKRIVEKLEQLLPLCERLKQ